MRNNVCGTLSGQRGYEICPDSCKRNLPGGESTSATFFNIVGKAELAGRRTHSENGPFIYLRFGNRVALRPSGAIP
jgi:hypothetical protein